MPLHGFFSNLRLQRFGFVVLSFTLLFYVTASITAGISSSTTENVNESRGTLQITGPVVKTDIAGIIADPSLTSSTIVLNGTMKRMVELPAESIAVMLPDDRVAIKSSEEASILPQGSTVTYYDEKPVISVPQQAEILQVSSVIVSPLENFSAKTNFIQSVQEVDVYYVQVVFFELAREGPDVSLVNYRIYWGDGTTETYAADIISAAHEYKKSGSYVLTVVVTDELGFTYVTSRQYTVDYEGHLTHSYLWAKTNKGPLTAATASFGLLAVGLIVFTESGRYKLLMLFTLMFPFYSHMQKEDVLDQFVRGQIYGFIKTNPGAHYNQILRKVGVKNGTLSYHLGVLEKTELIQSRREGLKYRAFYPTGMSFPKTERFRLTHLQIQIIESISQHPGMTQKELAGLLGQKPQTINYNIKVLNQASLIDVHKKGRKTICCPVPDEDHPSE